MESYVLVVLVAVLNILSLSLFKTGVVRADGIAITDIVQPFVMVHKFLSSPLLIVGVCTSICTNLLWLVTLTRLAANIAVPLMNSVYYVLLLFVSAIFLGEELGVKKVIAIGLIAVGAVLLARA